MAGIVDPRAALRDLRLQRITALRAELDAAPDPADQNRIRRLIRREKWASALWWLPGSGPANF